VVECQQREGDKDWTTLHSDRRKVICAAPKKFITCDTKAIEAHNGHVFAMSTVMLTPWSVSTVS